ncbi:cryptochrome/photolyase family protein [Thalassotalea euphylliae]|uniref:cryptochrome/photolyase family protein n=1 Tax=Thalassotalea euphylliae TaxID=1655234 RepID=UPI00363F41B5
MLLWFRNDLRITDNPALEYALQNGARDAIFFVSYGQWRKHHMAPIKIDFILRHVELLRAQLKSLDIALNVVEVEDFDAQTEYLTRHFGGQSIIVNQELELNERQRDAKLASNGVDLITFESDVILPKGQLLNKSGEMFKVFTPFKRAWLTFVKLNGFNYGTRPSNCPQFPEHTEKLGSFNHHTGVSEKWPLVNDIEAHVLPAFLNEKVEEYSRWRDFPGIKATSGLSPYFAIGALSARYVLAILLNKYPDLLTDTDHKAFTWLNEIVWREFYRHLLHHEPNLIKGRVFGEKYAGLKWPNNRKALRKWQRGETGYPIVDAAMKQLNQTGWMHNRLRMIVASFLTKHLLIDWRLGERYFTKKLIDWDFAANNGGWQWSAGTGCDAQPYFRIFNPITQSEKFDPKGEFIRKYLPELTEIPDKYIHFPHEYINNTKRNVYLSPIVDHKAAREIALAFYKKYI